MNKVKTRTIKTLKKNIHEEREAIRGYRSDAKRVDRPTAKRYREIAKDEAIHLKQETKLLHKLTKGD